MHFIIICNNRYTHIILVFLLYHIYKRSANGFSMIFGINKKIMNISVHYSVIHCTYHTDKLIHVPSRINRIKIPHCSCKLFRKLSG